MEKLLNYIKNGKGHGIIFLIAISVLITTFFMITIKKYYTEAKPKIELVAQDFLPITIKNNKIASPIDAYKRVDLNLSDEENEFLIPVILNTTSSASEFPKEDLALYITTDNLYFITPKEIKKIDYQDGIYDIQKFKNLMTKVESITSSSISLIMIIILLINFIIKSFITMLATKLFIKLKKLPSIPTSELMRLSCLITSSIELISAILARVAGYELNTILFYFLSLTLAYIYVQFDSKKQNDQPLWCGKKIFLLD